MTNNDKKSQTSLEDASLTARSCFFSSSFYFYFLFTFPSFFFPFLSLFPLSFLDHGCVRRHSVSDTRGFMVTPRKPQQIHPWGYVRRSVRPSVGPSIMLLTMKIDLFSKWVWEEAIICIASIKILHNKNISQWNYENIS